MRTRLPVKLKLAVGGAALTFVILCLFAVVIGAVAEQRVRGGFDDELKATVADLEEQLTFKQEANGDLRYNGQILSGYATGDAVVRLLNRRNQVVDSRGGGPELGPVLEGVTSTEGYRVVARQLVAGRIVPDTLQNLKPPVQKIGYVQYAKPEDSVERTVAKVRVFLAFGVLGGTLLAFLGGLLVARRAMRPIAGLTRAAREVARTRNPDITLPKPKANDEVSDLAHTFEDMLQELTAARGETEAALLRQRQFVADASHELRTPLTSILANLELLESELAGEQREMADSALRSSRRMRRLVADLLLLARADAGRDATLAPVDLAAIAREAAGEASALSADHPVVVDAPSSVTVTGVADDLHRMAANLVENALIHTPPGTPVTVSVRRDGPSAVLEVADRGPGVPAGLRARVFERFARGSGDGGARPAGSGLGLAIVRAVADSHDGRVELTEAEGGGARFVVTLPLAAAEAAVSALTPRELRSRR
jgi:two-component system OmpR family sensor kinase